MATARKRLHPDGKLLNTSLPKRVYVVSDPGSIFHSPSASPSPSPSPSPSSSSSSDDENVTTTSSTVQNAMQDNQYGFRRSHYLSSDLTNVRIRKSERAGMNARSETENLSNMEMRGGMEHSLSMDMKETGDSSSMDMRETEHSTSGPAHLIESYHGINKEPYHVIGEEPYHGINRDNYSYGDPSLPKKSKGKDNMKQRWIDSDAEASDLTYEMSHRSCGYDLNSSMLQDVIGEPYVNTRVHTSKRDLGFLNSRSSSGPPSSKPFKTEDMATRTANNSSSSSTYALSNMVIDSGRHLDRDTKWSYVTDKMESKSSSSSMAEDMSSRRGFSNLFPSVGRAFSTSTQNTYAKAKSLAKATLGQRDGGSSLCQESPSSSSQGSSPPHPQTPSYVLSSGRKSLEEEARSGRRAPTIDQDFEEYFSSLML